MCWAVPSCPIALSMLVTFGIDDERDTVRLFLDEEKPMLDFEVEEHGIVGRQPATLCNFEF